MKFYHVVICMNFFVDEVEPLAYQLSPEGKGGKT